ncbi:MAG: hypothetical protein KDA22_15015, partial [Phycisphaerales bacterium]|nr:hypothetical protein [Phycisphaerales bacterium]
FGACCDDATGQCVDNAEITSCLGPTQRFVPDTACIDLDPPCGVILGACCMEDASCVRVVEEECKALGGSWLGANTICSSCPCVVPCPSGSLQEGEPVCSDGYLDFFNGGCLGEVFAVSTIAPGQTVCGTSGVFLLAGSFAGDLDWYEVVINRAALLETTVTAEFRPQLIIADGNLGCPAPILASGAALECDELTVSTVVEPGVYWIIIGPFGATDTATCGAAYTLHLAGPANCVGDLDGNGAVDGADLGALLAAWGSSSAEADLDGSGTVDGSDLGLLLAAWGTCG